MESTKPITITIKLSKETKNTYRYDAVEDDCGCEQPIHPKDGPAGWSAAGVGDQVNRKVTDRQFLVRMQHQVGKPQNGGDGYFYGSWRRPQWS